MHKFNKYECFTLTKSVNNLSSLVTDLEEDMKDQNDYKAKLKAKYQKLVKNRISNSNKLQ